MAVKEEQMTLLVNMEGQTAGDVPVQQPPHPPPPPPGHCYGHGYVQPLPATI